jgi:hypothetical protein
MSRFISDILSAERTIFKPMIDRLENAAGEPAIDAYLTSEVIVKSKRKIRELGLDDKDTSPAELYHALIGLFKLHDSFISKRIGLKNNDDEIKQLVLIKKTVENINKNKDVWAIRHNVAKKLIKSMPPKLLMKQLGYRSVDSMLKKESIDDLFAGVKMVEPSQWKEDFLNKYKKLMPSDFEVRKAHISLPYSKKWQKISEEFVDSYRYNVIQITELGSVILLPMPLKELKSATLTVLAQLLHQVNELRLYSSYFKYVQVKPDFGAIVHETLENDPANHANMAGHSIHWRVIHHYFGSDLDKANSDVFGPHLQEDDLSWEPIEESLYKLEPALHFWYGTNILGILYGKQLISFNLMDVAINCLNSLELKDSVSNYLRDSLWHELLGRYLGSQALENQVLLQLDESPVESDEASASMGVSFA